MLLQIHSPATTILLKSDIVFPTCVAFPQSNNKHIQLSTSLFLQKVYLASSRASGILQFFQQIMHDFLANCVPKFRIMCELCELCNIF